jgi:hypothetical protein
MKNALAWIDDSETYEVIEVGDERQHVVYVEIDDEATAYKIRKALNKFITTLPPKPMQEVDLVTPTDADLVKAYIAVRNKRDEVQEEAKQKVAIYEHRLDLIQSELLRRQTEQGIDQIKVNGVGTVYRQKKVNVSCGDWDMFFGWCVGEIKSHLEAGTDPTEVFSFFQKRLTVATVQEYQKAHDGAVPPAVNTMTEYVVAVRKSSK